MIEIHNVHKWYGDFHVLKNINESVEKGEVLVICGPSGSGKSTLVRCVNRLEEIDQGEILIEGKNIHAKDQDINQLRAEIGIVFQQFNLYPHLTVLKNITLAPMKVKKIPRDEAEATALALLERVGIGNQAHKYPVELSGGQQQRVAIARAVVNKPVVLLLDEPLSALDYRLRRRMQLELKHLQRSLGITFILVTHDQEEAFSMSDRVAVMNQGRVEQLDTPTAVYENPANLFVARFVGEINVLPAEVVACLGEVTQVRVEGRVIALRTPNAAWSAGDQVHVLLRPEDLRVETVRDLDEDPELRESFGRVPAFLGVVEETVYKGATYDVVLRLDSGTVLTATEFFNEDDETVYFRAGDRVAVTWVQGWETVLPHAS
jgi:spermidine/putrescine transport system ATP-binding protein